MIRNELLKAASGADDPAWRPPRRSKPPPSRRKPILRYSAYKEHLHATHSYRRSLRSLGGAHGSTPLAQSVASNLRPSYPEWYNRFQLHRPFEPAGLGWALTLEPGTAVLTKFLSGILGSDEYYGRSGGTPQGYVQTLFTDVNGRAPSPAEYAFWLNRLVQIGGMPRAVFRKASIRKFTPMLVRYPQNWIAPAHRGRHAPKFPWLSRAL